MPGSRAVEDSEVGEDLVVAVVAAAGLEVEEGLLADGDLILIVLMDRFTTGRVIRR